MSKLRPGMTVRIDYPDGAEHGKTGIVLKVWGTEPESCVDIAMDEYETGYSYRCLKPLNKPLWKPVRGTREDGYNFVGLISPGGRRVTIVAGCQYHTTLWSARDHWRNRERPYLNGDLEQNARLNKWSLRFVDRVEKKMKELRAPVNKTRRDKRYANKLARSKSARWAAAA